MFTVNELNFIKKCIKTHRNDNDPENNKNVRIKYSPHLKEEQDNCDRMTGVIDGILEKWFDHVIELSSEARSNDS